MTIKGLQYFPLDVNFFENDKIAVVINDYGLEAAAVVLKLFAQIYKNGFYMKWNEKTCKVFTASFRSRFNSRQINQIIQTLTSEFVFEPKMFEKYQILTSKRIQTCFFAAASRRKTVEIEHPEYLLIDISKKSSTTQNVGLNRENACKNGKNVDIFEQSKVEESKVDIIISSSSACEEKMNYNFLPVFDPFRPDWQKDEAWLYAVTMLCGKGGKETLRRLPGAMELFETHIVSIGDTETILNANDYKRRFQNWWRCLNFETKEGILARNQSASRPQTKPVSRIDEMQRVCEEAKIMTRKMLKLE